MNLPVESNDDAILRRLSGANFGPNTKIILPSGKQIGGDEASAFSSLLGPEEAMQRESRRPRQPGFYIPLSSKNDDRTDEPAIDRERIEQPAIATAKQDELHQRRQSDSSNPLSSVNDDWTGDPTVDRERLVQRAIAAVQQPAVPASRRRKWWQIFTR